jgi:predicted enzyme related to lactoylglutathione lyase
LFRRAASSHPILITTASDYGMTIRNVLASVAVKDLKIAVTWYQQVFGRPADSTPMPELAEWKFPEGGWLQVYTLPERAGGCSCTLAVSNLDEETKLRKLGVPTGQRTSSAQVKTIMIKDPDGNSIALAEALSSNMAG